MFKIRKPYLVIVISGKRKSGKDYIAELLCDRFDRYLCQIVRLSAPLKHQYALENNLNYEKLLSSSEYKELFRQEMIKWGEEVRLKDPGYFCRHAILQSCAKSKEVWIVSDARRKSDLKYFIDNYPSAVCTVRISASDSVRKQRGWKFVKGVDDCESECGLDDYTEWDFHVVNNDQREMMDNLGKVFIYGASKLTL